jgi:hypothetical protein
MVVSLVFALCASALHFGNVAEGVELGMFTRGAASDIHANTTFHTTVLAHTGENRLTLYALRIAWREDLLVYRSTHTRDGDDTWSLFGEVAGTAVNNPKVVVMAYHGDAGWGIRLVDVAFDVKATVTPGTYEGAITFETLSMVNAGTRVFVRDKKVPTESLRIVS